MDASIREAWGYGVATLLDDLKYYEYILFPSKVTVLQHTRVKPMGLMPN